MNRLTFIRTACLAPLAALVGWKKEGLTLDDLDLYYSLPPHIRSAIDRPLTGDKIRKAARVESDGTAWLGDGRDVRDVELHRNRHAPGNEMEG